MNKQIIYILRCEFCGNETEFIQRDESINSKLTDNDIRMSIAAHAQEPYEAQYCDSCEMETLQKRIAWQGTIDI
jgi:hypothetical protein